MENRPNTGLAEQFAAAIDWWRDAGVDRDYADEPVRWIAPETTPPADELPDSRTRAPVEQKPDYVEPAIPAPDIAALPNDLAAFQEWWMAEPTLDEGRIAGRVPPRGAANAQVLVMVPEPEPEDRETLLSGPHGRMLDAMLTAMGVTPEQTYIASALPCHSPGFDWDGAMARNLGVILRRHVALAAPERVIVLGFNILPLIGHELPQRPAILRSFNHEGQTIPLLITRSLPALMKTPGWKAAMWRAWLEWDRTLAGPDQDRPTPGLTGPGTNFEN